MTVREWFRLVRQTQDARLWNNQRDVTSQEKLLEAIRIGTQGEVEFWLALYMWELTGVEKGAHVWRKGEYEWACERCGATVPSLEIDEREPPAEFFDEACLCPACRPCKGQL